MNHSFNINLHNGILEWRSKFYTQFIRCGLHQKNFNPESISLKRFKSDNLIIMIPFLIGEIIDALKQYFLFLFLLQ